MDKAWDFVEETAPLLIKMNLNIQKGLIIEILCQKDFSERGILLSQPIINDSRYDFIADIDGELVKIQCKYPHYEENNIYSLRVVSKNWNSGEIHNYIGSIDYFYTNINNIGYLIPISIFSENTREKRFRTGQPEDYLDSNKGTYLSNYELDKILLKDFKKENLKTIFSVKENPKEKKRINYFCKDCGKPISSKNGYCAECASKRRRIVERPTREVLKNLIRTEPFTKIAAYFNVTDNAIRKWCDNENLPRKKNEINNYSDEEWEKV